MMIALCFNVDSPFILKNSHPDSIDVLAVVVAADDIVRGFVKHQSRYIKRAPTHDCYQVYVDHFRPAA